MAVGGQDSVVSIALALFQKVLILVTDDIHIRLLFIDNECCLSYWNKNPKNINICQQRN